MSEQGQQPANCSGDTIKAMLYGGPLDGKTVAAQSDGPHSPAYLRLPVSDERFMGEVVAIYQKVGDAPADYKFTGMEYL